MIVLPWTKDVFKRLVLLNCTVESCLWFLGSVKDKERQVNCEAAAQNIYVKVTEIK